MNRRDAIQRVALLLGGTFSAPTLLAMNHWEGNAGKSASAIDFNVTDQQKLIIAEVAEMIIPRTGTPGAKDAGVPAFIVMMLQDCYKKPEHVSFLEGIKNLEQKDFLKLDDSQRTEALKQVERDTVEQMKAYQVQQTKMGDNEDREQMAAQAKGIPYWRLMKELTMLGYFTSEEGIKSSFDYVPIPGRLEMIQLKPNQKSFAY
ncbi:gluconate 2-dehydrogenase subunit 3 family protein [Dyadobacter pollutisoli]|uniref:Gluconate 2-dehydrogenase subunit 3 family protein n=1 Tax=Dyadobacter pollutisoli TaxID=2910158 RepID=A0A9E8NDH6_9BACT|nr:gluconate 2-dehydrogenase subunit 3 family protein [Dyadobacter pollutisoli]WAC14725.1 gluconate 2-dehydrogenase subunit 3 family protein [Dyadobacter pollutisoli]